MHGPHIAHTHHPCTRTHYTSPSPTPHLCLTHPCTPPLASPPQLEARREFHEMQRRKAAEREHLREKLGREADERLATEALQRAARAKVEARETAERARQADIEFDMVRARMSPSASKALVLATPLTGEGSFRLARTAREEKMHQMYGSALALAHATTAKARSDSRRPASAGVTAPRRVQV